MLDNHNRRHHTNLLDITEVAVIDSCRARQRLYTLQLEESSMFTRSILLSFLWTPAGSPISASYAMSKHAVQGFFKTLRLEVADRNVRVTLVCPGPVVSQGSANSATGSVTQVRTMFFSCTHSKLSCRVLRRKWQKILGFLNFIGKHRTCAVFGSGYMCIWLAKLSSVNIATGPIHPSSCSLQEIGAHNVDDSKKVPTARCAHLMAVAMANRLPEIWISRNPILLFTYLGQYLPAVSDRWEHGWNLSRQDWFSEGSLAIFRPEFAWFSCLCQHAAGESHPQVALMVLLLPQPSWLSW